MLVRGEKRRFLLDRPSKVSIFTSVTSIIIVINKKDYRNAFYLWSSVGESENRRSHDVESSNQEVVR